MGARWTSCFASLPAPLGPCAFLLSPWSRALISFTEHNYCIFQQFLCVISEKTDDSPIYSSDCLVEGCDQFTAKSQNRGLRQNTEESSGPSWAKLLRLSIARTFFFLFSFSGFTQNNCFLVRSAKPHKLTKAVVQTVCPAVCLVNGHFQADILQTH